MYLLALEPTARQLTAAAYSADIFQRVGIGSFSGENTAAAQSADFSLRIFIFLEL
jgi:hypothetical protein